MPPVPLTQAQAPLVLTLDLGSSSSRALLFDRRGRPIDGLEARRTHSFHTAADGTAEDNAAAVLQRVVAIVDEALQLAGSRAGDIGAVAMDTYVANLVGVDSAGEPLTPIYTYADTRAADDAAALRRQFDEATVQDRTGCLLHTSYLPARFMWLQRTQPELLKQVHRWLSLGEYVFQHLLGHSVVSTSVASWSGLLDRRKLEWDAVWLGILPITLEQLSPVVDVGEALSGLEPQWASRWPALRQVPWFPAIGDGAAANIGSGCTSTRHIALTLGTSGAMRVVVDGAPETVPDGLWCYRVDRATSLLGGATNEGGNVYTWLRQTLQIAADDEFDQEISALAPDGHGLTILPFLAGERSPGYAGNARAAMAGVSINTKPMEIARAMLESVAYRFRLIAQGFETYLPEDHSAQIIGSGGGLLRRRSWMQIFSDVLNRPLVASGEQEATSRGAALLALRSLGAIKALDDLPADLGQTFVPDAARHEIYRQAIDRQRRLYELLVNRAGP